jgi:hypothetical protein
VRVGPTVMSGEGKFSDFDLDFQKGKAGENLVEGAIVALCAGSTVEVKTDLKWQKTGNLYVETECFYQTSQQWELSGLSVTKATHWAFVLNGLIIILPTDDLRKVVEVEGTPIDCKIEPNPSRGFLIKPEHILARFKYGPARD